jgi:VIT1/CCC1 family predicted Fe2+/Mn2+ transporter
VAVTRPGSQDAIDAFVRELAREAVTMALYNLDRLHKLGGPVALAAALAVATVTSVPLLLAPDEIASEVAICILAAILATAGFGVGRRSGAGPLRSLGGGLVVLGVASVVVAVKIAVDH